jgi:putative hydrolase of the HAD superfamily
VKALLVDLDDTLLDYSGGVDVCWEAACASAAPEVERAALLAALLESRHWFWSDPERHRRERVDMLGAWTKIAARALASCGAPADPRAAAAIAEAYAERRRAAWRLFPEAVTFLASLRERGVPLALVTNGDARQQRDKIERHDLARWFDAILIEGEMGYGKPEEVVYREALRRLGAGASEAWMVGDHIEFDVGAPQRLGLRGVWVDRSGAGVPAGVDVRPHRIVADLSAMLEP